MLTSPASQCKSTGDGLRRSAQGESAPVQCQRACAGRTDRATQRAASIQFQRAAARSQRAGVGKRDRDGADAVPAVFDSKPAFTSAARVAFT